MMDILTSRVYRQEKSSEVMLSILNFAVEYRNGEGGGHMSGVEYLTGLLLRRLMAVTAQYSLTPEDVNFFQVNDANGRGMRADASMFKTAETEDGSAGTGSADTSVRDPEYD